MLFGGVTLLDRLLELMQAMWKEGGGSTRLEDAEVAPIPKKGDLQCCDN